MIQKKYKQYADGDGTAGGSGDIWSSLFNSLGGILTGAGNLASGIISGTPTTPTTGNTVNYYTADDQSKKNNTGLYLIVGVLIVAVITVAFVFFNKNKR